jgi:glycyl-tRNA synthetase beta chain
MTTHDILFELGTEELPSKSLKTLSRALASNIETGLQKAGLSYDTTHTFATPRRIAVIIKNVESAQKSYEVEKRGPALKAAFDADGHPTLACLGFASACNTTVDQLVVRETDKGAWVFFNQTQGGIDTVDFLPELIKQAISQLPIAKPMRWGNGEIEFIRPVQWAVLLYGKKSIKTHIFGKLTGRNTVGHRFHHPETISIASPNEYETLLREKGYVVADFEARKQLIWEAVQEAASAKGRVLMDEALLDEVTGLVEWPVALLGEFEANFLEVPPETVMTAMKSHQRYFPVVDEEGQLLPCFVIVSNIDSEDPTRVIEGNQRVIRARLSDAQFFYHSDLKHSLESRLDELRKIIFQKKLGTLFDKSERISRLMGYLAEKMHANVKHAQRAGLLCKTDLVTAMVGEFAELQGVMGYYYAVKDGEPASVGLALREQYQPRFAGDVLPETPLGALLSIADKIDTLVGLFGANQPPSGEKDPYALRRAALGILRILIEKQLPLNLQDMIQHAVTLYAAMDNTKATSQVFDFMMERLRAWYSDKGIDGSIFSAVSARMIAEPLDFHHRILAVQHFQTLPEASALIAANKRVSSLLKDQPAQQRQSVIDSALFEHESERVLFAAMEEKAKAIATLYEQSRYSEVLRALAALRTPIDRFFEEVMVMVDDEKLRHNRLALLNRLQQLFLQVADVALITASA